MEISSRNLISLVEN